MADFDSYINTTDIDVRAIELTSNQPTVRTTSLSGRQQVRSFGGQFYTASISMPEMTEKNLRRVYAFLVKQRGGRTTFTIAPHNLKQVTGTQGTSVGCNSASAGATSVTLDSGTSLYKAGDMIRFLDSGDTTHDKAYMITQDQSGTTTINFEPPLVKDVSASALVKSGSEFEMRVRLADDNITYSMDESGYGTLEFDIVEAV